MYGPLFERARIANFNKKEKRMYDYAKLAEGKYRAEIRDGIKKGIQDEIRKRESKWRMEWRSECEKEATEKIVKSLLENGRFSFEDVARFTGLTRAEVRIIDNKLFRSSDSCNCE